MIVLIVACALLLAACVGVACGLWRAQRRLQQLEHALAETAGDYDRAGIEVGELMASIAGSRIVIEVLEPISLARRESRFAGPIAGLAPGFINRRVYATVAREVRQQLAAREVEARVEVLHAGREGEA